MYCEAPSSNSVLRGRCCFLHKKKYGKLTVSAWLNLELSQSSPALMLLMGFGLMIAGIAVRIHVGSPYGVILALGVKEIFPPIWIMSFVRMLSFFTIGCAAGFVLGYREQGCQSEKYKGCMFFVLLAVLELLWYPTLFGSALVFLSALESILILCLSVCVTFSFYRVSKFAGMILLLHNIWLIYLLILNFAVLFHA